jgi:hypothetical protein
MVCFPLVPGKTWGSADATTKWEVAGFGPGPEAVHIVSTAFSSGDTMHLWFQKESGMTRLWDKHSGTYFELRVRLVAFQPAGTTRR